MQTFIYNILKINIFLFIIKNSWSWRIGEEKYWLPDLEWSTRTNWHNDKLPEENNRIIFPLKIEHSVGFPLNGGNLLFSGIDLPRDGSLLFPINGLVKLSNSRDKKFEGKVSEWKWRGPFYWVDSENWNGSNKATPHLEKIPCSTDTVILPNKFHSLSIRLPNENVMVKKIKIGSSIVEDWDWRSIMEGREFRKSRLSVKYSGLQYCVSEECLCRQGDDIDALISEICQIEIPRCIKNNIGCQFPLKVEGHCCDYCGGRVNVERTVSLMALQELSNEALNKYSDKVSWHVRMAWDENLEVLIMENGKYTGIKNLEAVNTLAEALTAKGLIVMSKIISGAPITKSNLINTLGLIFGIPIIIILLFFAALPYLGYSYTQFFIILREDFLPVRDGIQPIQSQVSESRSFGFARFENIAEGDIQLASTAFDEKNDNIDVVDEKISHQGKRFENPLYKSTRRDSLKNDYESKDENIIDINLPLSLNDLKTRVYSDETSAESE